MRHLFISLIIMLSANYYLQADLTKVNVDEVPETSVQLFFDCMMRNKRPEVVAWRNILLFGTKDNYVLYGRIKPKLFTYKIIEIYKVDSTIMVQTFPNYDKLSGENLIEILKVDLRKVEKLDSVNDIIVKDASFSLNTNIDAVISYYTSSDNNVKNVTYNLRCSDYSIIK